MEAGGEREGRREIEKPERRNTVGMGVDRGEVDIKGDGGDKCSQSICVCVEKSQ